MGVLQIGPVDLELSLPPRTPVNRSLTQRTYTPAAHNLPGVWSDYGLAESFLHVFQSQERCGFITFEQMVELQELEQAGTEFTLRTDFFGPEDRVETFTARFDHEQKPVYEAAFEDGLEWLFIMPLQLAKQPEETP